MRLDLNRHPDAPAGAVRRIMVRIGRDRDMLRITYRLPDNPEAISLPEMGEPVRTDGLWLHTCFELFVRPAGGTGYFEYNFGPSTQWAVYWFDDYRSGMIEADMPAPVVRPSVGGTRFELSARLSAPSLGEADWVVGLAAVIEEKNGTKSYWALAHPPGAPDFHHPDCFTLELPAAPAA